MDFLPKEIVLRSGRKLILRAPRVEDAQTLVEYLNATAGESPWLPREPGESRITSFEQEAQFIEGIVSSPDDLMLLAFVEGEFAGNCQISFMRRRKSAHRASIGITLYKKFWGMGIGTAMFREMLAQAKARGTEQVELAYIEGNERGKALYEKMGFSECGRMPKAYRFSDGSYHDEIFMIKYMNE